MSLKVPEAPIEAFKLVNTKIKEFSKQRQFRTRALRQAQPRALNLTVPHPIYMLTLEDIVQQRSLEVAHPTGWRYLIQEGESAIASAEVLTDASGVVQTFSQFNEGPFVGATIRTLLTAEDLPEVEASAYELRLLQIPALYVMVLWLKDTEGDLDLILPMEPMPNELEAGRSYTESEFLAALEGLAQELQRFDSSPVSS
jgi:hypothetical protein